MSRQWSSLNAILTCLAVILRFTFFRVLEIEMAIFGFNLTLTVIGVFFLRKLIPILNLPPRFLKGFYRFLPPSEQMLRETNNQPAKKTHGGNVKKRKNQEPEKKDFVVNKVKSVPTIGKSWKTHLFSEISICPRNLPWVPYRVVK